MRPRGLALLLAVVAGLPVAAPHAASGAAITITDKGTATCYSDVGPISSCTKSGVTIANGATIIVVVESNPLLGAVGQITWNGIGVSEHPGHDRYHAGTTSRVTIGSLHNVTGATGDVVVAMGASASLAGIVISVA